MKAKYLDEKIGLTTENIYKRIIEANTEGFFKIHIPHFVYVDEKVKLQLIEDGYKVYKGQWDGICIDALIIEW